MYFKVMSLALNSIKLKTKLFMTYFWILIGVLIGISCNLQGQSYAGKIGTHPDGYGGVGLFSPDITYSFSEFIRISVSDTNRPWQVVREGAAPVDVYGWPQSDFQVVAFDHRPTNAWANNNTGPCDDSAKYVIDLTGIYHLSFTGLAKISSWSDNPQFQVRNMQYDTAANLTKAEIIWPQGEGAVGKYAFMMLNFYQTQSNPESVFGTGIRNIRLIRPGYPSYTVQPFRTLYLNALAPFSTFRFMPFLQTNNQVPDSYLSPSPTLKNGNKLEWEDRQLPDQIPYTKGAPWETVIDLINMTGRDAWINIPHAATDQYVTNLAILLKNKLRPDVNIYLEYSNEVWNPDFPQYHYNQEFTDFAPEAEEVRKGSTYGNTYWSSIARPRRVAQRLIEISHIFETVLEISVASRTRIRPVFAWQIGCAYCRERYQDVLQWVDSTYGHPKDFFYAIASAPYFGDWLPGRQTRASGSPEEVVAVMQANSDAALSAINELAGYARQYGIWHLMYEGGPDNGGPNQNMVNLANRINANRTNAMYETIKHYYQKNWFDTTRIPHASANMLANYFVHTSKYSRYGCWGALEDLTHSQIPEKSPKFQALLEVTGSNRVGPACQLLMSDTLLWHNRKKKLLLRADALAPGGINRVEFFANATLIGADSVPPYELTWLPEKDGYYAMSAKAIEKGDFALYAFSATHHIKTTMLRISPDTLYVPAEGGEFSLVLLATKAWQCSDLVDWLSVSPNRGGGASDLLLSVLENPTNVARDTILTVRTSEINDTLYIFQASKPVALLSDFHAYRMKVYPNPAMEQLTMILPEKWHNGLTVDLFDANGKLISTERRLQQNTNSIVIDLNSLAKGIYFLKVVTNSGMAYAKFSKE